MLGDARERGSRITWTLLALQTELEPSATAGLRAVDTRDCAACSDGQALLGTPVWTKLHRSPPVNSEPYYPLPGARSPLPQLSIYGCSGKPSLQVSPHRRLASRDSIKAAAFCAAHETHLAGVTDGAGACISPAPRRLSSRVGPEGCSRPGVGVAKPLPKR